MSETNNLFNFATSELSQDAVICWCLNYYNYKDSVLYPMSKELLKACVDFDEQKDGDSITIKQQFYKTDILVCFEKSGKAVIIEDKVYSSEHDKQIDQYKKKISELANSEHQRINKNDIHTVYFKTGFYYDNDKCVIADKYVHGEDFLNILKKYENKNATLDMYIEYLQNVIKWYEDFGNFTDTKEDSYRKWNISQHYIAQYKLMREVFEERRWNKNDCLFKVRNGSNIGGRPWTELTIYSQSDKTIGECELFWRIDTDSKGPYFSLHFYNKYDANKQQRHIETYEKYYEKIHAIMAENKADLSINEDKKSKKGKCSEVTLLHFDLKNILKNWDTQGKQFIKDIRYLTDKIIKNCQ